MRQERGMGRERQFYPMGISMMEATRMDSDMEGYVMTFGTMCPKSCIYMPCMHGYMQAAPPLHSSSFTFVLYMPMGYSLFVYRDCTGSRLGIGMKVTMFGTRNMAREFSSILMAPNMMVSIFEIASYLVKK